MARLGMQNTAGGGSRTMYLSVQRRARRAHPLTAATLAPDARAVLLGVGVKPRELWAGDPACGIATGTVVLDGRALAGGAVVGLTSSQPGLVQVPQTVTVAPGWSTADFSVTSSSSDEEQTVTITAMFGGVSRSVTIAVHPSF